MRHYEVSGGTDIAKLGYGYSYASDRTYQEDLVNSTADELYGYDTLHRLTSFERGDLNANKDAISGTPAREQSWTLADIGNWTNVATKTSGNYVRPYEDRTHNNANEITQIDPSDIGGTDPAAYSPVHDDAGNLTSVPATDGSPDMKFVYDYRDRLIQAKEQDDSNVARYYYDGLNRRVKKDLDTGTDVVYLYDGWQVVEEREPDGQAWEARRQFIYGGTYIDEPLIFDKDTDSDGDCVDAGGSSRFFYAQQANFNVVAVTASDGTVVETVTYDPYGEATVTVAGGQSASGSPYLFQGRRWDGEADLYYFRNRSLSPRLGRFVQRDPVGYADGMDLYATFACNPVQRLDPAGRELLRIPNQAGKTGMFVRPKTDTWYTVIVDGKVKWKGCVKRGVHGVLPFDYNWLSSAKLSEQVQGRIELRVKSSAGTQSKTLQYTRTLKRWRDETDEWGHGAQEGVGIIWGQTSARGEYFEYQFFNEAGLTAAGDVGKWVTPITIEAKFSYAGSPGTPSLKVRSVSEPFLDNLRKSSAGFTSKKEKMTKEPIITGGADSQNVFSDPQEGWRMFYDATCKTAQRPIGQWFVTTGKSQVTGTFSVEFSFDIGTVPHTNWATWNLPGATGNQIQMEAYLRRAEERRR